jgi:hypothetical protein
MVAFRLRDCRTGMPRLTGPGVLLLCLLAACAQQPDKTGHAVTPASHATNVSRVVIPVSGGQTIRPPRRMADAQTLWSPFTEQEQCVSGASLVLDETPLFAGATHWLPIADPESVSRYLHRFTHGRRESAARALRRAEEHLPAIIAQLQRRNLPRELASLPLVESAFEPGAVSPAGAAGIWQLMPETARRFGLVVNDTVDERFDVHKSTTAATAYLAELYTRFGDWPLALAAYNSGEGTMQKALQQSGCATLADLIAHTRRAFSESRVLKEETLRFVPQFTAAVQVMTLSGKLGFTREPLLDAPFQKDLRPSDMHQPLLLSGRYARPGQIEPQPPPSKKISQPR